MKAVILAAGKGTRMLPLTKDIPKVLIEINGKPFLYYVLTNLKKAGYKDFCLVVGYKKEKIKGFLAEFVLKAELVEQKEQLGTGHALLQAKEFVGKEDCLVLGGDNLWSVADFKSMNKKDDFNYVSGVEVEDTTGYGILVEEKGLLKEIKEKPKGDHGNLINAALYKFQPEIFAELQKVKPSPRGEIELTDAVTNLAKKSKVKVLKAKWWVDLGKKEDIPKVEKVLRELGL